MILRISQYVHLVPLGDGRDVCLQAATGTATVLTGTLASVVRYFGVLRDRDQAIAGLSEQLATEPGQIDSFVTRLLKRSILTQVTVEEELAALVHRLTPAPGHDPLEHLRRLRRQHTTSPLAHPMTNSRVIADTLAAGRSSYHIILIGDCDAHREAPFLQAEGKRRAIDVTVTATFSDDLRLLTEIRHDAVILGALRARHAIAEGTPTDHGGEPSKCFVDEARKIIASVRALTNAPILINNLPIPTVQPLGLAGRGVFSHRNRFRSANLGLERVAEEFLDVYVVDMDAALSSAGKYALLDDAFFESFTHLAGPGWVLPSWPDPGQAGAFMAVPDASGLTAHIGEDPFAFEHCAAVEHFDTLIAVLGIDRRKCVIADLDGILWPGVLAETGSPFTWARTAGYSYALYSGIHEALKALKHRGILLACVSKNDEATVRELWRYDNDEPNDRLLELDDFASVRINWDDKVDNIMSVAAQLNLAYEHLVFVDDSPTERARVRTFLPDILVLGGDLFELRRWLLSDPRLQPLTITAESAGRTELVKAQLQREHLRSSLENEDSFRKSLGLICEVARLRSGDDVLRMKELFERTTQFNTTGRKFTAGELTQILGLAHSHVFSLHVRDRFGDHGLVGGCVVVDGDIKALAMSCRVLGLGVEHQFVGRILKELSAYYRALTAALVTTPRNTPVRNIYKDHGFWSEGDGCWRINLKQPHGISEQKTTVS